ncbi:hypothetical protein ACWDPG_32500, partial [Nocardia sp. NPDC003648]
SRRWRNSRHPVNILCIILCRSAVRRTPSRHREAPLTVDPEDVARLAVAASEKGTEIVWAPGEARFLMSALRHVPRPIFRKLPI